MYMIGICGEEISQKVVLIFFSEWYHDTLSNTQMTEVFCLYFMIMKMDPIDYFLPLGNENKHDALIKWSIIYFDPDRICCIRFFVITSYLSTQWGERKEKSGKNFFIFILLSLSILINYNEQNDDDDSRHLKREERTLIVVLCQ
jgi:hypothetical protein